MVTICYDSSCDWYVFVFSVSNQTILEFYRFLQSDLEMSFTCSETGLKPKARPSAEILLDTLQNLCWETSGENSGN